MAVLPLMLTVSASVNNSVVEFCTVAELYRLKVTVSVLAGLTKPVTVAVSAIELPTVALAGNCVVLIAGVLGVMVTGSAVAPLLTIALLLSPLKVSTQ